MRLSILFGQLIMVTFLIFSSACAPRSKPVSNSIKDSIYLTSDSYQRMLEAYQDEILSSDTILLGFRIGMSLFDLSNHLKTLIGNKTIIQKNNLIYALIPTNEYCSEDKDSLHHLVAEIVFHLDKDNSLKSIYASLYGPRFYIAPLNQRNNPNNLKDNPILEDYRKSTGDSFYNEQQRKLSTPEGQTTLIKYLLSDQVIGRYRIKYGTENHQFSSEFGQNKDLWIKQGKIIELALRDNQYELAKEYLERTMPSSASEFSGLVRIGSLNYSTIKSELEFSKETIKAGRLFKGYIDSLTEDEKRQREVRERKR